MSLDTDQVEISLYTDFANNHVGFRMFYQVLYTSTVLCCTLFLTILYCTVMFYQTSGEMNTDTTPGITTTDEWATTEDTTGINSQTLGVMSQ